MKQTQIEAILINNKKYSIFLVVFFLGGVGLALGLSIALSSFVIGSIGIFAVFISPVIFGKFLKAAFIKNAMLRFDNDHFSVDQINRKTGIVDIHDDFKYEEIASFKAADSAKDDSAFVKLFLNDGRTAYYTFLEQGKADDKDVAKVLSDFILAYNETRQQGEKITPVPMLLASKKAKYYIIGLTVLLMAVIIIQLIYHPKSIPISLFSGAILYLLLLAQRKRDLEQFNKMK
jgi:hypothetical protein